MTRAKAPDGDLSEHILAVRLGPGANCSSIGSAVEMLFLSATVGAAILAGVSAALRPPSDEPDAPAPPAEPGEAAPSGEVVP